MSCQHQHVVTIAGVQVEITRTLPTLAESLELAVGAQGVDDGATTFLPMGLQEKLSASKRCAGQQPPIAVWEGGTGTSIQEQSVCVCVCVSVCVCECVCVWGGENDITS